ncbi:Inorganic phosphate transporter 1-6 [Acorus gramineus]|uniref:H(+)/Pi cotransporter n=1 Tax=Acorus gramineus TaxID=55184 RepID=A0AAV9BT31_ACOGR|nr:Inorganic phosphate transporter 1-6 [Acorus gramineus]
MGRPRLRVIKSSDVAEMKLFRDAIMVVYGTSFFTDAYDLLCIPFVTRLLGRIYYQVEGDPKPGTLPPIVSASVTSAAFLGSLAGHLFFGWLGERMDRKRLYFTPLFLIIISSIASGLSTGFGTLCFFRFCLGFGIGCDHLLSLSIISKYSLKSTRRNFMSGICAFKFFGNSFAAAVTATVAAALQALPHSISVSEADYAWRLVLVLGALPPALTFYWRKKVVSDMAESAGCTPIMYFDYRTYLDASWDTAAAKVPQVQEEEEERFGLLSGEFVRRHGVHLLGTTATWFLLDIAFYSLNYLYQKDIMRAVGWTSKATASMNVFMDDVLLIALAQAGTILYGTLGSVLSFEFIQTTGPFKIQLVGIFFMTAFLLCIAFPFDIFWTNHKIWFLLAYGSILFSANLGPNLTMFIMPIEMFPKRLSFTCHGLSAASGKAGAMIAAFGFQYAMQSRDESEVERGYPLGIGVRNSLFVLAAINALGFLFTLLLVPGSKKKSLDDDKEEIEVVYVKFESYHRYLHSFWSRFFCLFDVDVGYVWRGILDFK